MGVVITGHEPVDDLLVENNLIYEAPGTADSGCYGIGYGPGGELAGANRAVIRRNRVFNVGGYGIMLDDCANCIIEDNIVAGTTMTTGIRYPERASTLGNCAVDCTIVASTGGIIRNNTLWFNGASAGRDYGIRIGEFVGANYVLSNNVLLDTTTQATCWLAQNSLFNGNNLCSTTASYFVSPTNDPATADFNASSGSPLVDAGSLTYYSPLAIGTVQWSASDAAAPRPKGAAPDVGAYER